MTIKVQGTFTDNDGSQYKHSFDENRAPRRGDGKHHNGKGYEAIMSASLGGDKDHGTAIVGYRQIEITDCYLPSDQLNIHTYSN